MNCLINPRKEEPWPSYSEYLNFLYKSHTIGEQEADHLLLQYEDYLDSLSWYIIDQAIEQIADTEREVWGIDVETINYEDKTLIDHYGTFQELDKHGFLELFQEGRSIMCSVVYDTTNLDDGSTGGLGNESFVNILIASYGLREKMGEMIGFRPLFLYREEKLKLLKRVSKEELDPLMTRFTNGLI